MPLSIPAFVQYQSPMFPLRGLWNRAPAEGDQFVNVEIDWLVSPPGLAVQFALSGNSPVALSQIVALSVDNGRCGSDVDFIFPDSGFVLTVAAHNQGLFPVFTNALMFYASAPNSALGDTTILQILNSLPPPIPIAPTNTQNHNAVIGVGLATAATTPVVPASISGTLNALSVTCSLAVGTGTAQITLIDGAGTTLWTGFVEQSAALANPTFNLSGIAVRFVRGIGVLVSAGTTVSGGTAVVNCYYTTP